MKANFIFENMVLNDLYETLKSITDPRIVFCLLYNICRINLSRITKIFSNEISIKKKIELINAIKIFDKNDKYILNINIENEYFEDINSVSIFITAVLKKFDMEIFSIEKDTLNPFQNKSDLYYYNHINLPAKYGNCECSIIPLPQTIINQEQLSSRNQKNTYTNMFEYVENCIVIFADDYNNINLIIEPIFEKNEYIAKLLENKSKLVIGCSSICKDIDYNFNFYTECKELNSLPFSFSDIGNESRIKMKDLIVEVLINCRKKNTDIIILPELTVNMDILTTISQWLFHNNKKKIIKMVIAGSFHFEPVNKENKVIDFSNENRCTVLSYNGEILWEHTKLHKFNFINSNLVKISNFKKEHKIPDDITEMPEHIGIGDTIKIIDTPIGRIVILICLDFLESNIHSILFNTFSNCVFIPAMSQSLDVFKNYAGKLTLDCNAMIFCSNSCWICNIFNKEYESFYSIPVKDKNFINITCPNITKNKSNVKSENNICNRYCLNIIEIP